MASTFPRKTDLPVSQSKSISLRLHKDLYRYLKFVAASRTVNEMREISIGDLIRDVLKKEITLPANIDSIEVEMESALGKVKGTPRLKLDTTPKTKQYELFEKVG